MSVLSELVLNGAGIIRVKEILDRHYAHPDRNKDETAPYKFDKKLLLKEWYFEDEFQVLTISNPDSFCGQHVLFLHGGAYVSKANHTHRLIIEALVRSFGLMITFLDYPLAPEYTYREAHRVCRGVYEKLTEQYPNHTFCLFGDSAGGGLALAFLQSLCQEKVQPLPQRTVLFSPWPDVTMSNPEISEYESLDPVLPVKGLIRAGKWYAGDKLSTRSPLVSPLYGDMENLGQVQIYVSTHEVLKPDCCLLYEKMQAAGGTEPELLIEEKMVHDWILGLPLPESKKALQSVGAFFTR